MVVCAVAAPGASGALAAETVDAKPVDAINYETESVKYSLHEHGPNEQRSPLVLLHDLAG